MDKETAEKNIITDLLIDILYRCFEFREGELRFDKYSLDNGNIQFLLKRLNPEKYHAIESMLKEEENDN